MDPFLPSHLRKTQTNESDASAAVTHADIALFLIASQDHSLDILSYIALHDQRPDAAVWIAKKLVEDNKLWLRSSAQLESLSDVPWFENHSTSLADLTNSAIKLQRVPWSHRKALLSLDELTSMPETYGLRQRVAKRALGQLWRSLGNMIVTAADRKQEETTTIMHRVLQIIAHLHHVGLIPDSVYAPKPDLTEDALQQPPTLHLLSSKILTALSDAQWTAHQASVKVATERLDASYFMGREIPGSRYKVQVTGVAIELWLELVLWSCLHGGWIWDGSAILEHEAFQRENRRWRLISWRELYQAEQQESAGHRKWSWFRQREERMPNDEERARIRGTLSSEVVTAFVDGLVTDMRVGVGARGIAPEYLLDRISRLKRILDMSSLSLGSATWDSVASRILESGGIISEKRPEALLTLLDLAPGFGTEVSAANAPSKSAMAGSQLPYFFEPTAVSLTLLHRAMRSFVHNGDLAGAFKTLQKLQGHTDRNKQTSLQHFFETIKSIPFTRDEPFTSHIPPIEFPAFDTQLSVPLLAKLLDLVTASRMYDLGRWLLFSEDVDGPLISREMYGQHAMAASIIRFGTMAGEHDLVLQIVKRTGMWNSSLEKARMPHELLTALLCSQIKLHRWNAVSAMQDHVLNSPGYKIVPEIFCQFAAELLRLSASGAASDELLKSEACDAFANMLYSWENLVLSDMRNELYCILGLLSTVEGEWKQYCEQFLAISIRQDIKLSTGDFNEVLGGVLDRYGTTKARQMVEMWCYVHPRAFEPFRAPGGLPRMATFRVGKGEEWEKQPENIEIRHASGSTVVLQGRIHPNRQTVWAILRKVRQEYDEQVHSGTGGSVEEHAEVRETLRWAARLLSYLGFDYEDIIRDLGSLAELAELEAPRGRGMIGQRQEELAS